VAIELVFESHSTTVDNEQGRATGWLPGKLSDQGRIQARDLGNRRRDDGIAAVFSSDLHRAVETASIAFGGSEVQGQEKGLRLTFPTVTRKNGEAMVVALQANVPLSAAKA
jgi:broad specificity phosphatase PhoE